MSTSDAPFHHGALREALLKAGHELLLEGGVDRLSLREAARRIGVSHNAPYKHFATREALLAALVVDGYKDLANAISASRPHAGSDPAVARGMAYVDFAMKNPALFRLMFSGAIDRTVFPDVQSAAAAGLAELGRFVGDRYGDEALEEATISAWAFVHGLAQLAIDGQLPGSTQAGLRARTRGILTAMSHALQGAARQAKH